METFKRLLHSFVRAYVRACVRLFIRFVHSFVHSGANQGEWLRDSWLAICSLAKIIVNVHVPFTIFLSFGNPLGQRVVIRSCVRVCTQSHFVLRRITSGFSSLHSTIKTNSHWAKFQLNLAARTLYIGPFTQAIFITQLDAIFVALKLQFQNRTCKPAAILGNLSPRFEMQHHETRWLSSSFTF